MVLSESMNFKNINNRYQHINQLSYNNMIIFQQIKACQHVNLFGKPGHGAPTEEIRKRRFTEYQLSDGTDNIPAENGDGSGLYSAYPVAMDDSCIPNRR